MLQVDHAFHSACAWQENKNVREHWSAEALDDWNQKPIFDVHCGVDQNCTSIAHKLSCPVKSEISPSSSARLYPEVKKHTTHMGTFRAALSQRPFLTFPCSSHRPPPFPLSSLSTPSFWLYPLLCSASTPFSQCSHSASPPPSPLPFSFPPGPLPLSSRGLRTPKVSMALVLVQFREGRHSQRILPPRTILSCHLFDLAILVIFAWRPAMTTVLIFLLYL